MLSQRNSEKVKRGAWCLEKVSQSDAKKTQSFAKEEKKRFAPSLLFFVLTLIVTLTVARNANAQEAFVLGENGAEVAFPNTVDFSLNYSGAEPVSAVLTYDVDKFSCVEVSADVPVTPDGDGSVEWQWVMSRSGNPPPGTDVTWQWMLTDAAGNVTVTEPQTVTLNDERYDWQTVQSDRITLNWYEGNVGSELLQSAETALQRLETEMGVQLEADVTFWIYGSAREMREAVIYISDWAGGVAFTDYNTVLIGVTPANIAWGKTTVAHELAHLVVGQYGRSCVGGGRPTWLEEGFATYAEGGSESSSLAEIRNAISDNTLAPIRSLTGAFPAHGESAGLAYSQSYSIVEYMLDTYGAGQMQQLILTLAEGESYDDALQLVYGLTMDSLEVEWRASLGAPARDIPPTLTPIVAAAVPTYPPISAAQDMPTPATFSGTPFPATETPAAVASPTVADSEAVIPTATASTVAATEIAQVIEPEPTVPLPDVVTVVDRSPNLLLWGGVGVLLLVIVGLLMFILKPR